MIKLTKGDKPAILSSCAEMWTNAVVCREDRGSASDYQKSRYNHPEIKEAIINETSGKCAYCESKVLHIDFGDIEHIVPKSERPELWFEWDNLTLACSICNNRKRNFYDENCPLLDPYIDNPEESLIFFGPFVRARPGDVSAKVTEIVLDLNRPKLRERRMERLDQLLAQAEVLTHCSPALREILIADFLKETNPDREYASLSRSVARELGFLSGP